MVIAAAKLTGVTRVFHCDGAQAIAALAFGTESIPAMDKIVDPGNVYVTEAKKQVFGTVGIDLVSGPSEVVIVADEKSDPAAISADMLAQSEHDTMSPVIFLTPSMALAQAVQTELDRQLEKLPRKEIAEKALNELGRIILCDSMEERLALANDFAPEHMELFADDPFDYIDLIENAGSVFLGRFSMVLIGDYIGGTNHALPTGGSARFASPLSADDFIKKSTFSYFTPKGLDTIKGDIAILARSEGFEGHARSALSRLQGKKVMICCDLIFVYNTGRLFLSHFLISAAAVRLRIAWLGSSLRRRHMRASAHPDHRAENTDRESHGSVLCAISYRCRI